MRQYLDLLQRIKAEGVFKGDRTGVGTQSLFGYQMRFDLSAGFPLLTTKKVHLRSVIYELLWLLSGKTNIQYLQEHGVTIWDEWADKDGNLGPVYGEQWRSWPNWVKERAYAEGTEWLPERMVLRPIDQVAILIEGIRKNPDSRRHIVTAWNPSVVEDMALPPCHAFFQFWTKENEDGTRSLSCQMYQRSADVFLGVPFNIASYALLTMMVAQVVGMKPGEFIHSFGDVHIYNNHREQVDLQLTRLPRPLPRMVLNPKVSSIDDFQYEDFALFGYNPHPAIKAPVAV